MSTNECIQIPEGLQIDSTTKELHNTEFMVQLKVNFFKNAKQMLINKYSRLDKRLRNRQLEMQNRSFQFSEIVGRVYRVQQDYIVRIRVSLWRWRVDKADC